MVFVTAHFRMPHKLHLYVVWSADLAVQAYGPKYVGGTFARWKGKCDVVHRSQYRAVSGIIVMVVEMWSLIDTASFNDTADVIASSSLARVIQKSLCRKETELIYIIKKE